MDEAFTREQLEGFFDVVWANQNPYNGGSTAICPNDGYQMKAHVQRTEQPQADITVYCPRCGFKHIDCKLDPRTSSFRAWTDNEKQEMVDCHFQGRSVICPVDETRIVGAGFSGGVFLHCYRCGNMHEKSTHHRIGDRTPEETRRQTTRLQGTFSSLDLFATLLNASKETLLSESKASTKWDLFISHAHEDKHEVAEPLARMFQDCGLEVWYDAFTLKVGDRLRRSIDQGLSQSKYGLVILSPHFFKKDWPQRELDGLAALETGEDKKILPVWHRVSQKEVVKFSPMLADRIGVMTSEGLENVVKQIMLVVHPVKP